MTDLIELTESLDVLLQLATFGLFGFVLCCALVAAWGALSD